MPEGIQEYSFAIASDFGVSFLLAVSHAFVWLSGRVRTEPGRATVTHAVLKIHSEDGGDSTAVVSEHWPRCSASHSVTTDIRRPPISKLILALPSA